MVIYETIFVVVVVIVFGLGTITQLDACQPDKRGHC